MSQDNYSTKEAKYKRINYTQRVQISSWLQDKKGVNEIVRRLGVDKSTVSRDKERDSKAKTREKDTPTKTQQLSWRLG